MANERVLIVDDEPQIRRALQTALAGHGYDVAVAADGDTAMTLVGAHPPDAIVLDLVMPGMDGFAVLRELRTWSEVPVIVLSARGQEQDKVSALDLGADDYLTKPFGMAELLARVRVVLRRRATTHETVIVFGDVVIDLPARIVTKAGTEVHLTPREYDLLRTLVANADKVLTHRHLLEHVWGGYASENAQQLRVYINYLRRKLEDDPARPQWIVTEPGVGYRLRTAGPTVGPESPVDGTA
jgi:two-component system KDP operon response regulator KdpE